MAIYSIYLPPEINDTDQMSEADRARIVFLPDTRSLLALVIPGIWLLWNRLWLAFSIYIAVIAAIIVMSLQWNAQAASLISVLPGLFLFLEGHELVRMRHERLGWHYAGIVEAPDRKIAELRYFIGNSQNQPKAVPNVSPLAGVENRASGYHGPKLASGLFPE